MLSRNRSEKITQDPQDAFRKNDNYHLLDLKAYTNQKCFLIIRLGRDYFMNAIVNTISIRHHTEIKN